MDVETPLSIHGGLKYFFNHALIPVHSGSCVINLMDYFPLLKHSGYAESKTINELLLMHMNSNMATHIGVFGQVLTIFVTPDDISIRSFGGDIPSFYYYFNQEFIEMSIAVESGIISESCTTFQVMSNINPEFNQNSVCCADFHTIINLNTQPIPEFSDLFQDTNFAVTLRDERKLANNIQKVFECINPSRNEIITSTRLLESSFMNNRIDRRIDLNHLTERLLADPRINKLICGIIIDDLNMVERYINVYDPRDNKFEAYWLAFDNMNAPITKLVRKTIIERMLLERMVFQIMMASIGGFHTPSEELYRYSRSLL
jgi:hypothetical protein